MVKVLLQKKASNLRRSIFVPRIAEKQFQEERTDGKEPPWLLDQATLDLPWHLAKVHTPPWTHKKCRSLDSGGCDLQNQAEWSYHKLGSRPVLDQFLNSKYPQEGNLDHSCIATKVWWWRIRQISAYHTNIHNMCTLRNMYRVKDKKRNKKKNRKKEIAILSQSTRVGAFIYIFL